jgi:hypothetical protein
MVSADESFQVKGETALDALPGAVNEPTVTGLPMGYIYGVTRYADIILQGAFPERLSNLVHALGSFRVTLDELRAGGGGRTVFVARFDQSLKGQHESASDTQVWGKRNITIAKQLGFDGDIREVIRVRGHEIDMFGLGGAALGDHFPGIAVEMEWNNKDPFYDRDLNNYAALHREGAIAVGVIVTRGPRLQELIGSVVRSKDGGFKYGQSTTHWNKLVPRVDLGGGGECPLLLVGIEPERIDGVEVVAEVREELTVANDELKNWRGRFPTYQKARTDTKSRKSAALDRLPPLGD